MFRILLTRLKQKYRTSSFPKTETVLPKHFRGLPRIDSSCSLTTEDLAVCPTKALMMESGQAKIDLGRCIFCKKCEHASKGQIHFSNDYRLAVRKRGDLLLSQDGLRLAEALSQKMNRLFGRSLRLRQVSAGGCNGCEADCQVLSTLVFDISRFGIQFVASPRHADGLLVTGPVTRNMKLALEKTYAAVAEPKIVIATGACAISGGPYIDLPDQLNGVDQVLPVDLYIPGCPPHPYTILDGLLRLLNRRS